MNISIILPHFRTWKMSFYAIHQLLKHRGRHQLDIWVVDNNPSDGTAKNLEYYGDKIKIVPYPTDKLQSHGIAYDYIIPRLRTEVFATIESDSFPEGTDWVDGIEQLVKQGYDCGGSCLDLSGGQFLHTAGAFYKKSIWQRAKRYVDDVEYDWLPNIAVKDGHECHLMVHESVKEEFLLNARNIITLAPEYARKSKLDLHSYLQQKIEEYRPVGRGVFHNGIGNRDESFHTYGLRHARIEQDGERHHLLLDNTKPFIWRLGYEPGQFFAYWMLANNIPIYGIPTETMWLPRRENQQQEFTKMITGFTHLWAVTAYDGATDPELKDIIDFKKNQMEELYSSIPSNQRI